MRDQIAEALKAAQKEKDVRRVATLRLVMAAINDRDISLRGKGKDKADSEEVLEILSKMVKQREESSRYYKDGGRPELEQQELEEIEIIREFMPKQMDEAETDQAICDAIAEVGAESLRDMGKVMAILKGNFTGRLDFSKASAEVKKRLGG